MSNPSRAICALLLMASTFSVLAQSGNAPPPAPVVVAEAQRLMLAPVIWFPGTVISRNDAHLAAAEEGRLLSVVDVGERVEEGDVVAKIDDQLMRDQLDEDKAAIDKERARLEFYDREVVRLEKLASGNNVSQNQLDEAIVNRAITRSELTAARARVAQTTERIRRGVVVAPFSGVVTERLKQTGEWASSGDAVIRLVDFESLEIQSWIPVAALAFVQPNTQLKVKVEHLATQVSVRTIVPVGDDRSKLYEVRLSAPARRWTVGQTLRVAVPSEAPRNVVAVPRDALVIRRDGATVYRIGEDNVAQAVSVELGIAAEQLIEVSGIEPGDKVVTRGGERLRAGQSVTITGTTEPQ